MSEVLALLERVEQLSEAIMAPKPKCTGHGYPSSPPNNFKTADFSHYGARRPWGEDEQRLIAAGWKPKERGGKIIWQSLDNGFYYSQEFAVYLDTEAGNARCKSGANGKG